MTTTVTRAVAAPALLAAVRMYAVVWVGETDLEARCETSPTPLSMLTVLAPEMLQENMADCPAVMVEGVLVNELMVGAGGRIGLEPTWTCPLAGAKPLADAVTIAAPIAMPLTTGARFGVIAPWGRKMFSGATVTFEESLLARVRKTPLAGAAVANVTGKDAESPSATVTFAGTMIWPEAVVPRVTVTRAVELPALLIAVRV